MSKRFFLAFICVAFALGFGTGVATGPFVNISLKNALNGPAERVVPTTRTPLIQRAVAVTERHRQLLAEREKLNIICSEPYTCVDLVEKITSDPRMVQAVHELSAHGITVEYASFRPNPWVVSHSGAEFSSEGGVLYPGSVILYGNATIQQLQDFLLR